VAALGRDDKRSRFAPEVRMPHVEARDFAGHLPGIFVSVGVRGRVIAERGIGSVGAG
jgi:hypothetical protein